MKRRGLFFYFKSGLFSHSKNQLSSRSRSQYHYRENNRQNYQFGFSNKVYCYFIYIVIKVIWQSQRYKSSPRNSQKTKKSMEKSSLNFFEIINWIKYLLFYINIMELDHFINVKGFLFYNLLYAVKKRSYFTLKRYPVDSYFLNSGPFGVNLL